jgi:hypothetical protein
MYSLPIIFETRPSVEYLISELSFIQYKELCKSLYYEEDTGKIVKILDRLIHTTVISDDKPQNIIEKILVLLEIRALTLGTDIKLKLGDKNITLQKEYLSSVFNKQIKCVEINVNNLKLKLTAPKTFLFNKNNSAEIIGTCLEEIIINEKNINFCGLSQHEQKTILDLLPGIPVVSIISALVDSLKSMNIELGKDMYISPFSDNIIYLLKAILIEPYNEVLELEYNLRRGLSMNTYDLQYTPYPECKIMLNKLHKEVKEKENITPIIGGPIENNI